MNYIQTSQIKTDTSILVPDLRTKNAPDCYGREDIYVTISVNSKEQYPEHRAEWKAALASLVAEKRGLRAEKDAQKGPGTSNYWYTPSSMKLRSDARRLFQIRQAVKQWNCARLSEMVPA